MWRERTIVALQELGVEPSLLSDFPELPREIDALLVYGSQARGDASPGSDLDLLGLVAEPRPNTTVGLVSVSYYTSEQLSSGISTLFGAHLKRDGRVLWDSENSLVQILNRMGEVDTERLFRRVRDMSRLFTTLDEDLPDYLSGLLRQARYLLRSALYAQAIAEGDMCFSIRELAVRHKDPSLGSLLTSRPGGPAAVADLHACLERLARIVGPFPVNQHGSLEATVVNEWGKQGDLLSMAFMGLGSATIGAGGDYAEVEKILL